MIVTLKTLQQQTFKIEIDGEETVKALKEKIEKEKGADSFPAGGQKLIYAGKILDDEKLLSTYKIEEKNFVVVMVTKPKPPAPASTAAPAAESSAAPAQATPAAEDKTPKPEESSQSVDKPASETTSTTSTESVTTASESESATTTATESSISATSVESDTSASSAESALVTGQAYEDVVSQMVNMGFPRDQVQRAMRASFNNPDRAVEYLFNGIPDMPREEAPQPAAPPAAGGQSGGPPASSPSGGTAPASGTGVLTGPPAGSRSAGEDALAFLRTQPQFQHMRTLIQQNPQLLPELLQQIGRSNPQLLQMISQNQEQFITMLNEQASDTAAQGGGGGGAPGEGGPLGQEYIQITQQEKEAIERLKALGFSEGMCIQAYFACEKNEELAANYLLSHGFDDEDS